MNFCWAVFKWALLAGVLAVVVAVPYLYRRVDDEIRRHVERKLAAHYQGLDVSVHSAELLEGKGILVRDVSIREPAALGSAAELLSVDEMLLCCRGDLEELVTGEPEISRIVIRRPTLRTSRRADGSWTAGRLLPLPRFARHPPEIAVEEGTIEVFASTAAPGRPLLLRHVNLTLGRPDDRAAPGPAAGRRLLEGTLSGEFFRLLRLEGNVGPEQLGWDLSGSVEGLDVSPPLADALSGCWSLELPWLRSLRGQASLWFRAGKDAAAAPCRYELAGQLLQGRLDDPRTGRPLTDLRAVFRMNNAGFSIDELAATSGEATLRASCQGSGFGKAAPLRLDAKIRQLEIDRQLAGILPEQLRQSWQKFLPAGRVNADLVIAYDGRNWKPEVSLECLDASFSYHKFPYRLARCTGSVVLKDDVLAAELAAYAGSRPVRVACRLSDPFGVPCGWVEAAGDEIRFDEPLYEAMNEQTRAVVRSFDPQGTFNCFWRSWRDNPQSLPHRRLVASLNRIRLRYDKFPYPMSGVCGTLEMLDDRWTCRGMEGRNDTAVVTCEGSWGSGAETGTLDLRLAGRSVPLEEELRDALARPDIRRLWNDLRPQGAVDLDVQICRRPDQPRAGVTVTARPQSEKTSIEPVRFPYRLEKIRGAFHYDNGLVSFERSRAEHGETAVSAAGRCRFSPDGGWSFQLEDLWVGRLSADRELVHALPERLRKGVTQLNPGGPLDLRGTLAFARGPQPDAPVRSQWELDVGFNQGSLDVGVKLENVCGKVRLAGEFDGLRARSRGELAFDSLTCRGVPLTEVLGPIWIDDDQVLLGSPADAQGSGFGVQGSGVGVEGPRTGFGPREITARVFGGTVFGHGRIARTDPPNWQVQANLSQCDLSRCAAEVLSGQRDLRGKLRATVDLWGAGRDRSALGGRGRVELREADIYELPVMIALLKILSIREPDLTAFSECDADFTIEGPRVWFNQIDFSGDAISLEGRGEMNLDRAVQLAFRARLGRRRLDVPILKDLLGGASEQMMLIRVGGTLDNPVTTKEPLPTIGQALEQLQSEVQKTTGRTINGQR